MEQAYFDTCAIRKDCAEHVDEIHFLASQESGAEDFRPLAGNVHIAFLRMYKQRYFDVSIYATFPLRNESGFKTFFFALWPMERGDPQSAEEHEIFATFVLSVF